MAVTLREVDGQRFLEATPGVALMSSADDVRTVLEACFEHDSRSLLLYSENLTARFFDLSSGEAGTILQKLRNYQVRLAVVRAPELRLSQRFTELMADESQGQDFRLFDDRAAAEAWLCGS